jgi:GxxExxY protein
MPQMNAGGYLCHLRHLWTIVLGAASVDSIAIMEERDPQTHAIIGAAMEVHTELGPGFLESVYQEALAREFTASGIPFATEVELPIFYKGERLTTYFRADFICFGEVVVELKALKLLSGVEESQLLNYLKATGNERGLLLNFGSLRLEVKRMVFTPR